MAKILKGKTWFTIKSPKFLGGKDIGETLAADPKLVIGRVISTTLFDITGDPSKYYVKLFFKVTELDGNNANTIFYGHDCTRDFVARVVQLFTTRIDTSDVVSLKDNKMRIKTIAVSMQQVRAGVASDIRKKISAMIIEKISQMSTEEFLANFISGQLQNDIRTELNKIYPLRTFEIRKSEVL